jgi:hypothetical protein
MMKKWGKKEKRSLNFASANRRTFCPQFDASSAFGSKGVMILGDKE